jgi:Amt family ammonium transporter
MKPHNVPFVALGAGLLWFGWFGFNAGSELTVDGITVFAFVNTQVATAAALLGWIVVEWLRDGKPTLVGASSGAVAGLVAITPACGFIAPLPAAVLGLIAGAVCALAGRPEVQARLRRLARRGRRALRRRLDRLRWVSASSPPPRSTRFAARESLFYGGGVDQLWRQFVGSLAVTAYSLLIAVVLALILKAVKVFRVDSDTEVSGIDVGEHAESAYDFSPTTGSGGAFAMAGIKPADSTDGKPSVSEKVAG